MHTWILYTYIYIYIETDSLSLSRLKVEVDHDGTHRPFGDTCGSLGPPSHLCRFGAWRSRIDRGLEFRVHV